MAKASDNPFPSVLLAEQVSTPTTPASGHWRVYAKSDGLYLVDDAGNVTGPLGISGGGAFYDAYVCVADEKAQGTNGGTATAGSWAQRTLNTERADTASIASLSSSQLTLEAGTYRCLISCPVAFGVAQHQARLYDTTGAQALVLGQVQYGAGGTGGPSSQIQGRFALAVQSVLEVQHRVGLTVANTGYGSAANFGTEVYTVAEFWREA